MKAKSSVFVAFAIGAIVASLPYTLSSGRTNAQGAGPVRQGGGGQPGQPQPGFNGGAGQGQFGQGQRPFAGQGGPVVNSMTAAGDFLFVASGDTVYKIRIESMKIEGQTKLPGQRIQPGGLPPQGNGGFGGGGRPGQGGQGGFGGGGQGGNSGQGGIGGGGQIPPKK